MVTVFDTSALLAGLISDHPQFTWVDQQIETAPFPALCAHSLTECGGVMTAHPRLRYPPAWVRAVLGDLTRRWTVLPPIAGDYLRAVAQCWPVGLQGAAIGDTITAQTALRVGAVQLVTLNGVRFRHLGAEVHQLVVTPELLT